jgi:hypothetical protein
MYILVRFNRKFMFCTDRGIHLSFWLCWEYAASVLGNFHFTTWFYKDFHFPSPPRNFCDFHFTNRHYGIPILPSAGRMNLAFQHFDRGRKPNYRYRCDKNVIPRESCFNFDYRLPLYLSFRFLRLYSPYDCNDNFEWLMKLSFGIKVIQ